jgi:hypothetical protein
VARGRAAPAAGAAAAAGVAAVGAQSAALSAPTDQAQQRRGQESLPEAFRPRREPSQLGLVVPFTWPSAYEDVVGFALWPNSYQQRFTAHGIGDILAAIFAPGDLRQLNVARAAPRTAASDSARALDPCTSASQPAADWPGRQIELAIKTNRAQRQAIDRLRTAVSVAASSIRASCRSESVHTPVDRLRAMQNQLWVVQEAAILLRAPLAEFFDSLSDEQKQQFMVKPQPNDPRATAQPAAAQATAQAAAQPTPAGQPAAAGADPRAAMQTIPPDLARMCGMPLSPDWPLRQIAQALRPNKEQRTSLEALQKSALEMGQLLMASCMTQPAKTPVERLDAATDRLTAVIFAASNVAIAVNDLYGQLSNEQKARFDALTY